MQLGSLYIKQLWDFERLLWKWRWRWRWRWKWWWKWSSFFFVFSFHFLLFVFLFIKDHSLCFYLKIFVEEKEILFVFLSPMNSRKGALVSRNNNGIHGTHFPNIYNHNSSLPSYHHPFSLSYYSTPINQPPLLPLPIGKSPPIRSVPVKSGNTVKRKQNMRKNFKKKDEAIDIFVKPLMVENVYNSPPPSSLPLPRFSLIRTKTSSSSSSCIVEAIGGGMDNVTTEDLRRLLGL